jgi:hypothetical protein
MKTIGHKVWAISGGHIPLTSTGREPEFLSFDQLCLLNASDKEAEVKVTFFYADRDPIGPYQIAVAARRIRSFRINDLIDPEAVPLDTDYACVIESDMPIVVQYIRQDTRQAANALMSLTALPML